MHNTVFLKLIKQQYEFFFKEKKLKKMHYLIKFQLYVR